MRRVSRVKVEFFLQGLRDYVSVVPCPHCHSTSSTTLARKFAVVRVKRCDDCGLSFTHPLYKPLDDFYESRYHEDDGTVTMPGPSELARLKETNFAGSSKDFSRLIAKLHKVVPGQRPDVLEVGSSWGYCLYQMARGGFEPVGLEVAKTRREFGCRDLGTTAVSSWEELSGRQFDLVFANHVLEHLTDLSTIFSRMAGALRPGGMFFVGVPEFDFAANGRRVLNVIGAVHPVGYDAQFFRRNLPKYGLEVVGTYGSWSDFPDQPGRASDGGLHVLARKV